MDWNAAIETNREALKRVLATLVAMVRQSVIGSGQSGPRQVINGASDCLLPDADCRFSLPRHLRLAVLRLLRPAEAAARRLIIVAARGMSSRFAMGKSVVPVARWKAGERRVGAEHRIPGRKDGGREARLSFPMFDPLRRFHHRRPARSGVPRVSIPGFSEPFPIPPPPSPFDSVDATRLALRLAALARVLDDLPRAARRFARWRARELQRAQTGNGDKAGARTTTARNRRLSPLRGGPPPGLPRRPSQAVDDILEVTHGLAFWVLEQPDTS